MSLPERWTDGISNVDLDDLIPSLWACYPVHERFSKAYSENHTTSEVMDSYGMSYRDIVREQVVIFGKYDPGTVERVTGMTHTGGFDWVDDGNRVHPDDLTDLLISDQAFMASFKGWYDGRSKAFDALDRSGRAMDVFSDQLRSGSLLDIGSITELTGFHPVPVASKTRRKGFGGRFR